MRIFNPDIAPPLQPAPGRSASPDKIDDRQIQLDRLKKACRDFESIFISYVLKNMRKTSGDSELFGDGLGGEIYQEIFDEKLAENMAQSNQLKIGDILFNRYAPLIGDIKKSPEISAGIPGTALIKSSPPLPDATGTVIQPKIESKKSEPPKVLENSGKSAAGFDNIIHQAAEKFGLKPGLIKAVIKHESGGDPRAVSGKGAKGLMQLIDSTAAMLGVSDPFSPSQNIMAGARYLSMLLKRFGGDLTKAVASYNAGPGTVEKYGGIPPFPETQKYVKKVLASMMEE